jgi:ribosome modulation factor
MPASLGDRLYQAFCEGERAYKMNKLQDQNPYNEKDERYKSWDKGYRYAGTFFGS